jgi:hypothetical protein
VLRTVLRIFIVDLRRFFAVPVNRMVFWLVLIYFVDGAVRFAGILKDIGERKMQMLNHENYS